MRIALLSHAHAAGAAKTSGLTAEVRTHAHALKRLGHEVRVFAAGDAPGFHVERVEGIDVTCFSREGGLVATVLSRADGLEQLASSLVEASDVYRAVRRELVHGRFDVVELLTGGPDAALVAICDPAPVVARVVALPDDAGSRAERFFATRLTRVGLRAARAVSTPSMWLRERLTATGALDRQAWVVPDGVEAGEPGTTDPNRVVLGCFSAASVDPRDLAPILSEALVAHDPLHLRLIGHPQHKEWLDRLRESLDAAGAPARHERVVCDDESALRTALGSCDASFSWTTDAPACPREIVVAMATGTPVLVRDVESMSEAIRHEIDGLLLRDAADAKSAIRRVVKHAGVRSRLAKAATRRAAQRYDPIDLAQRRLQLYALATRERIDVREPSEAGVVALGPHDWFTAWWLARTPRVPTELARDAEGVPLLLGLEPGELRAVEKVLTRGFCDGPADWQSKEWRELRALGDSALDRIEALRGAPRSGGKEARLVLPAIDHPLFDPDQPGLLLDEAWQLERSDAFAEWLVATATHRDFATRALDNVHLRRIAVEAARLRPSPETFDALRRIYRHKQRHERVVADDVAFLRTRDAGDAFARGIAELGLHAPLPRERFPSARKRPGASSGSAPPPRVTVLIPSYRHERFVAAAVESSLRQSIDDVRVLVADDRSPDRTVEVARAIDDPRVEVTVNDRNLGLGRSVLDALSKVDTPFVALLNSDDLFHPDRLERCLAVLEKDPDAALVATGFAVVDADAHVLSHETACALDVGPRARGWLRWFEEVTADYRRPEDWTSFENLLRHNVLATSSNLVVRTDWLREHFATASELKYCVDWFLFLSAAMEERLRMIPEPLLAYRLHDANTVWFREGGRADYVMEVNHVVTSVLHGWVEARVRRDGGRPALTDLARLLEEDVARHGETDGFALYLTELSRQVAAGHVDSDAEAVGRLAEAALRRTALVQATRDLDVDPWSLPWRSEAADRYRVEHEVAEGFVARARSLEDELARLRLEIRTRRDEVEDARAATTRAEQERDRHERALEERAAAIESLREQWNEEKAARESAEAATRERAAELEKAATETKRLESERDELTARIDAAERQLARLRQELAELRHRLESTTRERDAARDESARRARVRDRAIDAALRPAARAELDGGSSLWERTAERTRHATWHAMRATDALARARRRIVVFGGERPRGARGFEPLLEVGREDGLDARLIAWESTLDSTASELLAGAARPPALLADDGRPASGDLAYFEARIPSGLQALRGCLGDDPAWFHRALRAARAAKTLGAGVTVAHGLGLAAVEAMATRVLCGVPYALVLGDEDLVESESSDRTVGTLLRHASLFVTDADSTARAAAQLRGEGLGPRTVRRWPLSALRTTPTADRDASLALVVPWEGWHRADVATLVAALRTAVDAGVDFRLDVLGTPQRTRRSVLAHLELQDALGAANLGSHVAVHAESNLSEQRKRMAQADVALWVARGDESCGVPAGIVGALRTGCPVIASDVVGLPRHDAVRRFAVGDASALTAALRELSSARAAWRENAARTRETADAAFADGDREFQAALLDLVREHAGR